MKIAIRLLVIVLALAVLLVGGVYAIGGRAEGLLLVVRFVLRKEAAPNHDITWQRPAAPTDPKMVNGKRAPNVILIVADDLGYNDITLNGGGVAGGTVPTPNINRIATEGVNFATSYSGNATCAPSRAAMMTGRYPTRFGFEFTPTPKQFMQILGSSKSAGALFPPIYHAERESDLIPYENMGLPTSEITLAKLLKVSGYRTLHVGKWHLGDAPAFRSYNHGFDEALSFEHGASMFLPENDPGVVNSKQDFDLIDRFLWAAGSFAVRFNDGKTFKPKRYATDYLTDEALSAIDANKASPFFLYLAYNAPHTPLQATKEDYDALAHIQDHTMRVYAAMVRNLDRNIGRVLQDLKDKGLDDNTVVIFTSDNGGAHYIGLEDINKPFRGWKATFFEGGIRVPMFLRWPAGMPKGVQPKAPVNHMDIFATVASITGAKLPTDRPIDGINLMPQIAHPNEQLPERPLYWRTDSYRVIRENGWKLQVTETPKMDRLYNLNTDPTEKNNVAASNPQKVAELKAKITAFNSTQIKPLWPSLAEGAIAIDHSLKQPFKPDEDVIYYAN